MTMHVARCLRGYWIFNTAQCYKAHGPTTAVHIVLCHKQICTLQPCYTIWHKLANIANLQQRASTGVLPGATAAVRERGEAGSLGAVFPDPQGTVSAGPETSSSLSSSLSLCHQVQRQVPQEQCRDVPRQQCQTVPRQKCQNVPRQQCR